MTPQRVHCTNLVSGILAALWLFTLTLAIATAVLFFAFGGCISAALR